MKEEKTIKLKNGKEVYISHYVKAKTKDLIEFGYDGLTENEVLIEVEKILNSNNNLTIIGGFCVEDIFLG